MCVNVVKCYKELIALQLCTRSSHLILSHLTSSRLTYISSELHECSVIGQSRGKLGRAL